MTQCLIATPKPAVIQPRRIFMTTQNISAQHTGTEYQYVEKVTASGKYGA